MVNLILKFVSNPKNKNSGELVSFYRKKICFILNSNEAGVKADECWECFLWADRGKFYLVKPHRKINEKDMEEEQKRVDQFNQELLVIERYKNADFDKVVFDPESNKPYLRAKISKKKALEKYEDYIVKSVGEEVWARPILNAEDRAEFRSQPR